MKWFLSLLVLSAACASPGVATQHPPTILAPDSRGNLRLETGEGASAVSDSIDAPYATVWGVLKQVYAALDVPVTLENPGTRQIGNTHFWKSRRFAGHAMTDLVNCGNGVTGPRAADFRIYMSLITRVVPTPSGANRLETTFVPGRAGCRGRCNRPTPVRIDGEARADHPRIRESDPGQIAGWQQAPRLIARA